MLEAVPSLLPPGVKVVCLADRGFADTELRAQLRRLGWHFRMRIKANFSVQRFGYPSCKVEDFPLAPGRALFLQNVAITAEQFGPISLALARHTSNGEYWYVVSDEPPSLHTVVEYGGRFAIEDNFLADKSNSFQLERSLVRDANALTRLCLVLALPPSIWSPKARRWGRAITAAGWIRIGSAATPICASAGSGSKPHWPAGGPYLPHST